MKVADFPKKYQKHITSIDEGSVIVWHGCLPCVSGCHKQKTYTVHIDDGHTVEGYPYKTVMQDAKAYINKRYPS